MGDQSEMEDGSLMLMDWDEMEKLRKGTEHSPDNYSSQQIEIDNH